MFIQMRVKYILSIHTGTIAVADAVNSDTITVPAGSGEHTGGIIISRANSAATLAAESGAGVDREAAVDAFAAIDIASGIAPTIASANEAANVTDSDSPDVSAVTGIMIGNIGVVPEEEE